MNDEDDDICGLCGEHGADKIPHPIYWPQERRPDTDQVHAECEAQECQRASDLCQGREREDFIDRIIRG